MTKEERKEYGKKYRADNKEEIAAKKKVWRENNKEHIKNYNQSIKKKAAAYSKVYRESNREKILSDKRAWSASKKDGLFTVYLLTKENYVGQTNSLYKRLNQHKNKRNRNVSDVQILGKYNTREEARAIEDKYHNMGYLGAYNNL
tara:strand:- start:196 stop:630 length:435 start_codon:yes stop_codon:yes gene_type:complete